MQIIRNQEGSWVLGFCLFSLYLCHLFRALLVASTGNDWKHQEYHRTLAPQYALAYLYPGPKAKSGWKEVCSLSWLSGVLIFCTPDSIVACGSYQTPAYCVFK